MYMRVKTQKKKKKHAKTQKKGLSVLSSAYFLVVPHGKRFKLELDKISDSRSHCKVTFMGQIYCGIKTTLREINVFGESILHY